MKWISTVKQDWAVLISEGKCRGQGTQANPYIIDSLKINGRGAECINILGVRNVYYKIMNCELYNGSYDIRISYADMGDIIDNKIVYNNIGISTMPYSPLYCRNKAISGNSVSYNTEYGIDAGEPL